MQWLLADAHGGANSEADDSLVALLELGLKSSVDLYLLGDLFAVWLGPRRFLTPFQRKVVQLLRQLKNCGQEVVFVVGNRDYLIRESQLGDTFSQVIEEEGRLMIGGRISLLLHGDRINPEDRLYHLWHRLSRNSITSGLLQKMPTRWAQSLSTRLEAKLSKTNQAYKSGHLPLGHLEDLSRRAKLIGVDQAIIGHFHADTTVETADGVPVIIAPAWLDQRKILIADKDGSLKSTNPLL